MKLWISALPVYAEGWSFLVQFAREWAAPKWLFYKKHRPVPGLEWIRIIENTAHGAPSRYHPNIDVDGQRALEMDFQKRGTLLRERGSKRTYYWDTGSIVGAGCGEETRCILVEWSIHGEVHGYPITLSELVQKGAKIK